MRLAHAGRGFRPDETKELLVHLLAAPGPHCLMLRLNARDVERALGPVLIDCLTGRVRLAIEAPQGEPPQVAHAVNALAAKLGRRRPRVGLVEGNDLLATQSGAALLGLPCDPPPPPDSTLVAAQVRFGAEPLLALFAKGAEVLVSGPLAPSAASVAFARYARRWGEGDHVRLAAAAAATGRILSANAASVGGDLYDPGIDGTREIGLPLAGIAEDGGVVFESTRDALPVASLALALLDGIDDPRHHLEPDVALDLDDATLTGARLSGVRGGAAPGHFPGTLTFETGFVGEGELGYGGTGAAGRAIEAARALEARLASLPPGARARRDRRRGFVHARLRRTRGGPRGPARQGRALAPRRPRGNEARRGRRTRRVRRIGRVRAGGGGRRAPSRPPRAARLDRANPAGPRAHARVAAGGRNMTTLVPLRRLAHARARAAGSAIVIALALRDPADWRAVRAAASAAKAGAWLSSLRPRTVRRIELAGLASFHFRLEATAGAGRGHDLAFDLDGRAFAQKLLDMPIEIGRERAEALSPI
jgi:hypothetical protein